MARRKATKGICGFCGVQVSSSGFAKHLAACLDRRKSVEKSERRKETSQLLFHLRAMDSESGAYWIDLEMRGSSTLEALDSYLRAIWLECCGHLSNFTTGGWSGDEIGMKRKISEVFGDLDGISHLYDFGSTSHTIIKAIGERKGKPINAKPVYLMARNIMPERKCMDCGEPASYLCLECVIEEGSDGTLCSKHSKTHPHDNYGSPIGIVNSPRLGICGYTGPATPPY